MNEYLPINKAYQIIFSIINSSFLNTTTNLYSLTPFYQENLGIGIYISVSSISNKIDYENIKIIIHHLNNLGYIFELQDIRKELTKNNICLTIQDIKVKI
mgnify:CR=1 FL=1